MTNRTCSIGLAGLLATLAGGCITAHAQNIALVGESSSAWGRPLAFVASHDLSADTGDLVAQRADPEAAQASPVWSAAQRLRDLGPDPQGRVLLSAAPHGVPLRWSLLSATERIALGLSPAALDSLRTAPLGAIVNANLWFAPARLAETTDSRAAMVYAGTARGLLHGFDAADGSEKFAYLPRGLQPQLAQTGDLPAASTARAGVDGPVFVGQARLASGEPARSFLVGALGAAGRGFFVLDVSAAAQASPAAPPAMVHTDQTATTDADVGQIHAPPVVDDADANRSRQVVRLNDGRWAVVMGNGSFSPAGRPVLLIQYLDDRNRHPASGERELRKLSPCQDARPCAIQGGNGLAPPRLVDVDGNGTVDIAYAGDLQGHVWKFDLSGPRPEVDWRVALSGEPLFVARTAERQRQAITTAPYVVAHPRGGLMLVVGTGRPLQPADAASPQRETLYGLYDDSLMALSGGQVLIRDTTPIHSDAAPTARPASLVEQRYTGSQQQDGVTYHQSSNEPVRYDGEAPHRGWFLDLPLPGQRVLQHPRGFEGHKVLVASVVPDGSTRWLAGASHVSVLHALTGQPARHAVFTPTMAGAAGTDTSMASTPSGPSWMRRLRGRSQLRFADGSTLDLRGGTTIGQRAGWREHH